MKRRDLIVGLSAVALMGSVQAQQSGKVYRIAIVSPVISVVGNWPIWDERRAYGYVEGQNLLIERYSGEGRAYPDLARDVVHRNPDVIIAFYTDLVLALKAATTTIPIVGGFGVPVEAGIVQSLARPGGNITGVSVDAGTEEWSKRIQLLQQVVPQATRVAFLVSHSIRDRFYWPIQELFRMAGATLVGPPLYQPINEAEYRRVFAAIAQNGADGIIVSDDAENIDNRRLIVELAEKHRLPAIYTRREFVEAGGLMSYGVSLADSSRRMAGMVAQILKGAKPADIPVFQPGAAIF
jgi:putative tryptophan/tyrosine transport system substrate-binding protein